MQILKGLRSRGMRSITRWTITDRGSDGRSEAVCAAISMIAFLPDKAIDLIDEASSRAASDCLHGAGGD